MTLISQPILESGQIIHRLDGAIKNFRVSILGPEDLAAVLHIEQQVLGALDDLSFYYPSTAEIFHESLTGGGLIIGCWVEERLIGFRSIWYPRNHPENLGLDIGLHDPTQLAEVAHLERSCVIPEYRGNRVQIIMTRNAIALAMRSHCFRYLFSTVAPMNYPSMKDKFEANMVIFELKKKYADYYRYIFFRDIANPVIAPANPADPLIFIDAEDIEAQMQILQTNSDIVGCLQQKNHALMQVGYAKSNHPFL
jgi:hypothetical protein